MFGKMGLAVAIGLGAAIAATPSNAVFIIDDFNTSTTYSAVDGTTGGAGVFASALPVTAGNIAWGALGGGANLTGRQVGANLAAGDPLDARICANCQVGEYNSDNGTRGRAFFDYFAASTNVAGHGSVMIDYRADLSGGVLDFFFQDAIGNAGTVSSGALAASLTFQSIMLALPGNVDFSQLRFAQVLIDGRNVTELDAEIDNFKLVPEPATLGLFGFGLIGLGLAVRRRKTA